MPITSLDGRPINGRPINGGQINGGQIGPVTRAIRDGYWAIHYDPQFSFQVQYERAQSGKGLNTGKL